MLTVLRDGYQNAGGHTPTRKEYQAGIGAEFYRRGEPGTVAIVFSTNPQGDRRSAFRIYIDPQDFEIVAREMLKADPKQAIRAFGAAMQDFEAEKSN
jgi:hypothetical protein